MNGLKEKIKMEDARVSLEMANVGKRLVYRKMRTGFCLLSGKIFAA